jgi:ATP citrate (pro-S)-lyase
MLVDHGPYVSGAVNTIVAARAGKDLVSSLAAGMLTIGPRFGGAINAAAGNWLSGAQDETPAREFTETIARSGGVIPGIGHKKYRLDMPDPRVEALLKFTGNSNGDRYMAFARSVEKVTTAKKDILILNVDGAIAALMLDILESELGYDKKQLQELVDIEFFNALFVLSRSVGFTAHYLDQRRHDEGLLRLSPDDVRYIGF